MLISRSKVEAFKGFGASDIVANVVVENVNKQYSVKEILLNNFSNVKSLTIENKTSCYMFLLDGTASINFENENFVSTLKLFGAQFMKQMLGQQLIVMVPPMQTISINTSISSSKLSAVCSFPVDGVSGALAILPTDGTYNYNFGLSYSGSGFGIAQKALTVNSQIILNFFDETVSSSQYKHPIPMIKQHALNMPLETGNFLPIFDGSLRNNSLVVGGFSRVVTCVNTSIPFSGNPILRYNSDGTNFFIRASRQYTAYAEFFLHEHAFFDGVLDFITDNAQNPVGSINTIFIP
jgi:hypothetical protein